MAGGMCGVCAWGVCMVDEGGVCMTEETATAAGGMHPIGMHSCFIVNFNSFPGLTTDEVLAQAFMFFFGGYDTTASAISFLLYLLAVNPEIQEELYQEIVNVTKEKVLNFFWKKKQLEDVIFEPLVPLFWTFHDV